MKALWLTSWYPNKTDRFAGDFIQRQAIATALYVPVKVIHVEIATTTSDTYKEGSLFHADNLKEEVILLGRSRAPYPFNKIMDYLSYISSYKKSISAYIEKEGVPAIVHVHVAMKAGIIALWLKRKYGIPYVVTEHWTIYDLAAPDNIYKKNFFFRFFIKAIFKHASLVLPVSTQLGQTIRQHIHGINFRRIFNVVDTTLFHYREKDESRPFTFIHVSVMSSQKNPESILRAFEQFIDISGPAKLYMVGPYTDSLFDYARSLRNVAENIIFTGMIEYSKVATYMQLADALVLFSRYENMPCVILESLCCGLPVISSDVGGIREVIDPSNGILVAQGNEDQLTAAMVSMFKNYAFYNNREIAGHAQRLFSYPVIGRQIDNAYLEVINKPCEKQEK